MGKIQRDLRSYFFEGNRFNIKMIKNEQEKPLIWTYVFSCDCYISFSVPCIGNADPIVSTYAEKNVYENG